jgi:hypothetical protein
VGAGGGGNFRKGEKQSGWREENRLQNQPGQGDYEPQRNRRLGKGWEATASFGSGFSQPEGMTDVSKTL